ncbi:glycosyltransferase family 4 protein [Rhodococcus erythropolis]|uniref:glycosyltransferase family 4 protein n=1 Tax=Rhodococcus erythropolis TaxID=1833 RepID=UPI00046430FA|nr:glycosyltransferase family 4 protein [Rhodococcus erythropolis]MBO8150067.1 glycosyltransferase family 4 protein [Rhodococcus erythropolis]MDO1492280.1 glycosyltransferase family 4 protein [Rhodococcus erythropolis]GCB53935.1 glycosyl transferase [Rhodococcus erythropolis]
MAYIGAPAHRALVAHPGAELYGSDRIVLESVTALTTTGWDVTVMLGSPGPLAARVEEAGADAVIMPIPVLRKSKMSPTGLLSLAVEAARSTPSIVRTLRRFAPDVVYVSTVTIPWLAVVAKLLGYPVIFHVHEAEDTASKPIRMGLSAQLLLSQRVIANSNACRELILRDIPTLGRRVRVIYNGVAGPSTEPTAPRLSLTGPIRLVLVGRIAPRKGTDVAVEALAILVRRGVDVTLDLVGGVFAGYEWFEDDLSRIAAASDVSDRIRYLGVVEQVWETMDSADIALVPSRAEPFGNVAVEAQLFAKPVLASAVQGLTEIIEDGRNGLLVEPGNAVALADAIQSTIESWGSTREQAIDARTEALTRFSPERYRADIAESFTATIRSNRK